MFEVRQFAARLELSDFAFESRNPTTTETATAIKSTTATTKETTTGVVGYNL